MDRILRFCFIVSVLFLTYLAGVLSVYYKLPMVSWVKEANVAAKALSAKKHTPLRTTVVTKKEVPIFRQPGTYGEYTLYTGYTYRPIAEIDKIDFKPYQARLIDLNGTVVHTWERPFSKTFPSPPHIADPVADPQAQWRDAYLYPNGDLLITYEAIGDTPYGYGLEKIDKNSKPIWHYDQNVHHTVSIGDNGIIYALTQSIVPKPEIPGVTFANNLPIQDWLVWLTPDGKELGKISIFEALANSPYKNLLEPYATHKMAKGDIFHVNSTSPLTKELAPAFPMFKEGQVLISLRNANTIGVLDLKEKKFVWTAKGPWVRQHYVQFLPEGAILIYDNVGGPNYTSRIIKYFPATGRSEILPTPMFYSPFYGMQQLLPNGNLLITSSMQGKIMEATKQGKLVWEFTIPYANEEKPINITVGRRFTRDELPFLKE